MGKKKKINLLLTCIFFILIGMFIIGKGFAKGEVKAEPVKIVATAANKATVKNIKEENPQSNIQSKDEITNQVKESPSKNQIDKLTEDKVAEDKAAKDELIQDKPNETLTSYNYDALAVSSILNYREKKDGKKIAFLTFDDGPSTTVTPKILDILKQYNVKATFFLVGENIDRNEESKGLVKREFNEGHSIGNHTYSHNRGNKLFPNKKVDVPVFMEDVQKTDRSLKDILGENFSTRILRLPGGYMSRIYYGDPNLPALNASLRKNNMISIDWNVLIKDAEGKPNKSVAELVSILKEGVQGKEKVVILMHDTYGKMQTANALPEIIEYLKAEGYEFRTIN